MKKMKTRIAALLGVLALTVWGIGLAGCSHDGGGSHHDNKIAVTDVTVTAEPTTLYVKDENGLPTTATLTATVAPSSATDKSVSWQNANSSRADLSATTGDSITVTARKAGSVTITATAGGKNGFATIIVYADAASEAKFQEVKGTYTAGEKSVTIREDGIVIIDGEESEDPAVVNDDGSLTVGGHTITVTNDALTLDNTTYEKVAILLTGPSGSTKHNTIKGALAAIPTTGSDTYTITLQPSTYNENGLSYSGSATIVIEGSTDKEYGADVIIAGKGSNQANQNGADGRNLLYIDGSANLVLKNVTLKNTLKRSDTDIPTIDGERKTQAEALGFNSSGTVIAYNSSFLSHQDTIRTTGKGWFYKCYIEGDVDFLWMEKTGIVALYEDCEIKMVGDDTDSAYIAAPRMDETNKPSKGLVVYNSKITVGDGLTTATLARTPWSEGYYNQVAYINNTVDGTLTNTWKGSSIATRFDKTDIGWKLDKATAAAIGHTGTDDVLSDRIAKREYNGRYVILNRVFNTETLKYEKAVSTWDAAATLGISVAEDTSKNNIFLDYADAKETSIGDALTVTDIGGQPVTGVLWSVKAYKKYTDGVLLDEITDRSVTIGADGKIKNDYIGNVYVEVTATKGAASDSIIVYNVTATKIKLSKTEVSVAEGSTVQLEASFEPAGASAEVVWTSSNQTVVTVEDGLVTAQNGKSGSIATITATIKDTSISAKCEVTVTDAVTLKKFGTSVEGADITKYGTLGDGEYLIYPVPIMLDAAGKAEKDFAIEAKINYTSANSGVGVVSFKDGAYSDGEVSCHAFATPGGVKSSAGGNGYDVPCSETSGDFIVKAYVTAGSKQLYFELVDPNGDVHKKDNSLRTLYVPDANDYIYLAIGGTTGASGGMTVSANDITITEGDAAPANVAKFEDLTGDKRTPLTASGGVSYTIASTESSAKGTKFTIPLTQDMLSGLMSVSPSVEGTWSWDKKSIETPNGGDVTATATFIPDDRTTYKAVLSHEVTISVTDNRAVSDKTFVTVTWFPSTMESLSLAGTVDGDTSSVLTAKDAVNNGLGDGTWQKTYYQYSFENTVLAADATKNLTFEIDATSSVTVTGISVKTPNNGTTGEFYTSLWYSTDGSLFTEITFENDANKGKNKTIAKDGLKISATKFYLQVRPYLAKTNSTATINEGIQDVEISVEY